MRLGELLLRLALLASTDVNIAEKVILLGLLAGIQMTRSLREKRMIKTPPSGGRRGCFRGRSLNSFSQITPSESRGGSDAVRSR